MLQKKTKVANHTETNIQIALALGFEPVYYTVNGRRKVGNWKFPDDLRHLKCQSPEHHLPDFLDLIERALNVGIPLNHDYSAGPDVALSLIDE